MALHRESTQGKESRYLVVCLVLAAHVVIVSVLVFSAKTRIAFPTEQSIELLHLPPRLDAAKPPPPTQTATATAAAIRPARPEPAPPVPTQSLSVVTVPTGGTVAPSIDWAQQAHDVAAATANTAPAPPGNATPKSPFAPPAAHHSGDEFVTATGDHAVFINEHCYQVSKTFADAPNGISNGMGTQTYCISPSNTARGDLFEQLPVYKKLHPNP